ncbi:hypothetical protein BOX15_Mlig001862g5, partial [Macrostomum lignano]
FPRLRRSHSMSQAAGIVELKSQVNSFFDDVIAQLEARRSELIKDIEEHEEQQDGREDAYKAAANSDAEQRLEIRLRSGHFDAMLASRRTHRLLDSLKIDWRDEWMMRREADNPFASTADAGEADSGEDCQAEDFASCDYQMLQKVDFGTMLRSSREEECSGAAALDEAGGDEQRSFGARGGTWLHRRPYRAHGIRGVSVGARARPYGRGAAKHGSAAELHKFNQTVEDETSDENSNTPSQDDCEGDADDAAHFFSPVAVRGQVASSRGRSGPRSRAGRGMSRSRGGNFSWPSQRGSSDVASANRGGRGGFNRGGHTLPTAAPDADRADCGNADALSAVQDALPFEIIMSFSLHNFPVSLTYLSNMYFSVELPQKRIFVYSAAGKFLKVFFFSYRHQVDSPPVIHPYRIRSCSRQNLLIVIDRSNRQVLVTDPTGRLEFRIGPEFRRNRQLEAPEDAISTGELLIISSPAAGIYIVSLVDDASKPVKIRQFTSLAAYGLFAPVRLAWDANESRLVIVDQTGPGAYRLCALKLVKSTSRQSAKSVEFERAECQGEAFQSLVIPSVEFVQNRLLLSRRTGGMTEFLVLDRNSFSLISSVPVRAPWLVWNLCPVRDSIAACCNNGCVFSTAMSSFM